jgi:hypothetical protein
MKAQIKHFSDAKNSMIQSAVNEHLANDTDYKGQPQGEQQGLNSDHGFLHLLNQVLHSVGNSRKDGGSHENFVQRALDWVKHQVENAELKFAHSDFVEGFAIFEQYLDAKLAGNTALAARKLDELKYSDCDPEWVDSMVQWFRYYLERMGNPEYVAYSSLDDFAYELPPTADGSLRVGLIGDWGTGEPRAVQVLKQLFALKPDLIIHLGDVYYSGTEHEYEVNYHAVIDKVRKESKSVIPVYNLPGNHDYYSGGHAFYQSLKTVNRVAPPGMPIQEASYFALFNEAWHIQAMDTGYFDNNVLNVGRDTTHLKEEEVKWHQNQLDKALAAGRKVVLLSHHQLFSRYLAIADQTYNADLMAPFKHYIEKEKISAWFWGHEHLVALYKPYLGLEKGRCLGHGAVPIFYEGGEPYDAKASVNGVPLPNLPEVALAPETFKNDGTVYYQGFALLELQADKTGKASYYTSEQCAPIYQEQLI